MKGKHLIYSICPQVVARSRRRTRYAIRRPTTSCSPTALNRREITQIQGQDAYWILPSEDQPADMSGQAALIVRYTQPVRIGGDVFHYFIQGLCDAHPRQQHLEQITSG